MEPGGENIVCSRAHRLSITGGEIRGAMRWRLLKRAASQPAPIADRITSFPASPRCSRSSAITAKRGCRSRSPVLSDGVAVEPTSAFRFKKEQHAAKRSAGQLHRCSPSDTVMNDSRWVVTGHARSQVVGERTCNGCCGRFASIRSAPLRCRNRVDCLGADCDLGGINRVRHSSFYGHGRR